MELKPKRNHNGLHFFKLLKGVQMLKATLSIIAITIMFTVQTVLTVINEYLFQSNQNVAL